MNKGRMPVLARGPFFCLLLASCQPQTTPGAEENRQLDDAATMLDSAPATLNAIDRNDVAEPENPDAAP
ncbi:hypothetical protein G7078_09760 [Sphingomonas sinipercae]|uniref:Uncharacterized protein n=1 Tax=Sphingomonas sinipercae TaxID=2714944 RepID=A0A6G7ZQ51_9SPHN|nr:hypothetical protein [Sphingomonas sinipercae]QIL03030.1 hypothetical protein G7078_09760 [Sphingomonas sinipercae]